MTEPETINYTINDPIELNLSYMPFIASGGLFVPTTSSYSLGDKVIVDLLLPGRKEALKITGKVIWITPKNALYHVLPGIGIQFLGENAQDIKNQIEANVDRSMEIGGYTYGLMEEKKKTGK